MNDFDKWLRRRGEEAMRKLWKIATDDTTTPAERLRLLTFFAEMAIGKARTMDALQRPENSARYGVVVLPEVMAAQQPPADFTV